MLIPDRLWAQMTEEEQDLAKDVVKGLRNRGRKFKCPHCDCELSVALAVDITAVELATPAQAPVLPRPGTGKLPTHYQQMLDAAKASELFEHFRQALWEQQPSTKGADLDIVFCKYWNEIAPLNLTRNQLHRLLDHYGQSAEIWAAHGVIAVVRAGVIVAFLPQRFTKPAVGIRGFQMETVPQLESWVKGPYGYVPEGARGFAAELRRQNIGKFGLLVQ